MCLDVQMCPCLDCTIGQVAVSGSFYWFDLYFVAQNLILFIVMSFVNEGRAKDENFLKARITDSAVLSCPARVSLEVVLFEI